MPLLVYLDEAGDHTLELVDREFPLFVVALFICDSAIYSEKIVPAVYKLKMQYFGHEAVILHSRDIRKAQGDFGFLTDPQKRQPFYSAINKIMSEMDYTLVASVIRKQAHKEKYGMAAANPYDLALKFSLERLLPLLEEKQQSEVCVVAEARGKREDDELKLSFLRIVNEGTEFIVAERFRKIQFRIEFKPKAMNIIGTQLADLSAYPIARKILYPDKENPAYDIIEKKFYKGPGGVKGLKVFP